MLNKRMIHNNDFSFHILKLLSPEIKFRIFIKITHPIYLFNKMRLTNSYKTVNVNARKKDPPVTGRIQEVISKSH